MMNIKKIALSFFTFAVSFSVFADEYVIIGKESKVFDEPDATGYVTLNTSNEEVSLVPGMVFKTMDNEQGWYIIEYSPGLRGYLSEQAKAVKTVSPKSGTYTVSNNPSQKLTTSVSGDKWNGKIGDKTYPGQAFGDAVVFFDEKGNPAYSMTDIGNGAVVISYDNAVTKFF